MKSLMTFVGILAFNFSSLAQASEFSCPVSTAVANYTCSGTVKVTTLAELNAYRDNLGVVAKKPTVAKNLQIAFNPSLTADLTISTPCSIKIPANTVMNSTANICLHGAKGVSIDDNFKFTGKNLKLESKEEVIIDKGSILTAADIKILSIGSGDTSKAYVRDGAVIRAANLTIESFDKGFLGKNSDVILTGALGIYTLGDDEASIRQGAKVEAQKIEVSSTYETRVANLTKLTAEQIILNGKTCNIHKSALITSTDRLGNCFLTSLTKAKFSIDKNQGINPLTINFNASTIVDAKGFIWSFGDGETVKTLAPTISHIYTREGSFTAILQYATKDNYKGLKSAGAVQIDVKAAPVVVPTTPPGGTFNYVQDGTFVYLSAFIKKTQFDIVNAYYVFDDNQNNKLYLTNAYQNSKSSAELYTYGVHKITLYVEDARGQKYNTTIYADLKQNDGQIAPYIRFYGEQSAARTAFINMSSSFIPSQDQILQDFTVDFGDGQVAQVHGQTSITHTYAQAGTYNVKVSSDYRYNVGTATVAVTVTDENKPVLNPVAWFDYHILGFAGNVTFADDRSGTPNGQIISYEWNFGDGQGFVYGQYASHFFAPGDYLVSLTVTDTAGLRSTQTQKVHIETEGDNLATALSCWEANTKTLDCNIFALDKANQITRVKVDWGDGTSNIFTEAGIQEWGLYFGEHVYQNYGTYTAKLTVDTSRGQTKYSYTNQTLAPSVPVAKISCYVYNLLVNCNGLSSYDPSGSPLSYSFNYDDSYIETNVTGVSTHAFSTAGLHSISLTVKNNQGQSSVATMSLQALAPENLPPNIYVSCNSSRPFTVSCDLSQSTDYDGSIIAYQIKFSENVAIQKATPIFDYTYASAGIREIEATLVDNSGGVTSKKISVEVLDNHPPYVSFDCWSNKPHKIDCLSTAYDTDPLDQIIDYEWNFGDEDIEKGIIPGTSHYYSDAGSYLVKLKVKDQYGLTSEKAITVNVKENTLPFAIVNCSFAGFASVSCIAYASDADSDGEIISLRWALSSGQVFYGNQFTYNLNDEEKLMIKLSVTDNLGGVFNKIIELAVPFNPGPTFEVFADVNSGEAPLVVNFDTEKLSDPNGEVRKIEWIFPNNEVVETNINHQEGHIVHTFTENGIYEIKIRAYDDQFKYTEKLVRISVGRASNVTIQSDLDKGLINQLMHFSSTFNSLNQDQVVSYKWIYQGKIVGTSANVDLAFDQVGVNTISLEAVTNKGIAISANASITIISSKIYIAGVLNRKMHIGGRYMVKLEPQIDQSIDADNVSVELVNAPEGMSYDAEKDELSWTPLVAGLFNFKIKIFDGIFFSEKSGEVEVIAPSIITTTSGGYVTNKDSFLYNAYISTNTNSPFEIIETETSSGHMVSIRDTNNQQNDAIGIRFPTTVAIKNDEGQKSNFGLGDVVSFVAAAYRNLTDTYVCPGNSFLLGNSAQLAQLSNLESRVSRKPVLSTPDFNIRLSSAVQRAYNKKNYEGNLTLTEDDLLLIKLVDNLKDIVLSANSHQIRLKVNFLNIYLMTEEENNELVDIYGYHLNNDLDKIFLNATLLKSKEYYFLKATFFHESYHDMQTAALRCRKVYTPADSKNMFKVLEESSAEYFSIANLSEEEKNKYLKDEYAKNNDFLTNSFYNTFKRGALNVTTTAQQYIPIYLWQSYSSAYKPLDFLDIETFIYERAFYKSRFDYEYADNDYVKKLMKEYFSSRNIDSASTFLDINSNFYPNNYKYLDRSIASGSIYYHYESAIQDQFSLKNYFEKSLFKISDFYPSNISTQANVIPVKAFGGNFYILNTDNYPNNYLAKLPTLLKVLAMPSTGVRLGADLELNPPTASGYYYYGYVAKDGKNDGDYKFIIFNDAYDRENSSKNYFLNFANPTGEDDQVIISKTTLCKTVGFPSTRPPDGFQWVVKVACDGDCREIKQVNTACSGGGCLNAGVMTASDYRSKLVTGAPGSAIAACQTLIKPNKEYNTDSDLDFILEAPSLLSNWEIVFGDYSNNKGEE